MTTLDILRKARALIAKGWTRRAYERGRGTKTRYCSSGAIRAVVGTTADPRFNEASDVVERESGMTYGLPAWNDRQKSKKPVLAAFDRAIKKLETSGG